MESALSIDPEPGSTFLTGKGIAMEVDVGMKVVASDGPVGEVGDIVINPIDWTVTNLVVEPHHHHEKSRLIPMSAVTSTAELVTLSWSTDQVEHAPKVAETDFVVVETGKHAGTSQARGRAPVLGWPYYPMSGFATSYGTPYPFYPGLMREPAGRHVVATKIEKVPSGTIEVRRASAVVSSDDHVVGHVDGFVVDGEAGITHLVLQHGHLWGHRDITIPIADVAEATWDRVYLNVERRQIGAYPDVPFHRHHHAVSSGVSAADQA